MNINKDYNSVKFIATRFSLPLFMVSRNRLKYTKYENLEKYIAKNVNLYNNYDEKEFKGTTLKYFEKLLGVKKSVTKSILTADFEIKTKIGICKEKSWQLPPNRYDTLKIPFNQACGLGGAYWLKEHTHQPRSRLDLRKPQFRFNNLPTTTGKITETSYRYSGFFLSNARERRATSRCMVSNIGSCYKDPTEPGPFTYSPNTHKKQEIFKCIKKSNPHLFYRLSTVPMKINSIHRPHTSFTVAPGRYEVRYGYTCPCSPKLMYTPGIDLLIDKEKRNKFRRLPYVKIKRKLFVSPDWRHVKGKGFCHLFKGALDANKYIMLSNQEVKEKKNLQLYPDSKYIAMITNPARTALSFRKEPIFNLPSSIKYNCIVKIKPRKQLRNNKKIAFNSGQERFRDGYRLTVLSQKQQELIKQSLPLERQLRDHPIMNKHPSEIKSKIFFTPKHMLPHLKPKLRKKLFKFLPLPQAKVLITDNDTNVHNTYKNGFYLKVIEPKNFFKDNALL